MVKIIKLTKIELIVVLIRTTSTYIKNLKNV